MGGVVGRSFVVGWRNTDRFQKRRQPCDSDWWRVSTMRLFFSSMAVGLAIIAVAGLAQQPPTEGPYSVKKTAKVGGDGGFDYVYADADARQLYVARSGPMPRVSVFNLDTL